MDRHEYLVPTEIAETIIFDRSHRNDAKVTDAHRWLRDNLPFGLAEVEGYDPVWLVSKYSDLREIEVRAEVFHNGDFNQILKPSASDRFQKDVVGNGSIRILDSLSAMDDPEHRKLRAVSSEWFRPHRVRELELKIRTDAVEAVERLEATGGECDFVQDFALHFPLHVIMSLLGVPREDEPFLLSLSQGFFGTRNMDPDAATPEIDPEERARRFAETLNGFFEYFDDLIEDRRKRPRDDYATLLANATVDGKPLEQKYCRAFCVSMAAAGHDTTSSSVAGGMLGLLRHPGQLKKCLSDNAVVPGLVEESVRYSSPVKHFMRSATETTSIRGVEIGEGERLMLLYASANRDEEVFSEPDSFDVERSPNKHLAFGVGPHMCLGIHVARLEMRILWETLLPRLKTVELAGEPTFVPSSWVGGLKHLPISFSMR